LEQKRTKHRVWYRAHTKEINEKRRTRRKQTRSIIRKAATESTRRWRHRYPERAQEHDNRRRARRAQAPGSFTAAEFIALCIQFRHRCAICGKKRKLTVDHIIPLSRPGTSNSIGNIQPVCRSCNSAKRDRLPHELKSGAGQMILF
jgi:5-methylcytosine-specific restriction endonuclease McrA